MSRSIFNKKRNNLGKAVQDQEDYIKLRDSVFDSDRAKTFSELEAKYQNEKKHIQFSIGSFFRRNAGAVVLFKT